MRDLYVWAYERSTQEYLSIKQDITEPDPLRLTYRSVIKQAVHDVVTSPEKDPLAVIRSCVTKNVSELDKKNVRALIIEELRRLHEGVLARYNLRISEFTAWKTRG